MPKFGQTHGVVSPSANDNEIAPTFVPSPGEFSDGLINPDFSQSYQLDEFGSGLAQRDIFDIDINEEGDFMINGIKTLNRSAELQGQDDGKPMEGWHLAVTLIVSIAFALLLSLVLPHGLTWLLTVAGISGDVSGVSFQLWDGLFKLLILMIYILAIRRVPEIKRVFQYHGAEHKTIHAFETGKPVDADLAAAQSRLHPRCGTTFLLFVVCVSVLSHALLVPLLLHFWTPESELVRHGGTIFFKLLLIAPIASLSYELIRATARMKDGKCAALLRTPGLLLQKLTTAEPEREQLEVALVALREALGDNTPYEVRTVPYKRL